MLLYFTGVSEFHVWANLEHSPAAVRIGASLGGVTLARDTCKGAAGTVHEDGRPTVDLTSVGLFVNGRVSTGVEYGLRGYLHVDVGNLFGGDGCRRAAVEGSVYEYLEALNFLVEVQVSGGALVMSGGMIGVWRR